ncbi:MAG: 2-hydroxyacid dehydrogenase [Burkholderiales bacterium]|nr:2-hydroxyacid dehydrogenase [Burkholderiales bacterium]
MESHFTVHKLWQAADPETLLAEVAPRVRGMQATGTGTVAGTLIERLPKLEIIACCGVGYDGIDVAAARRRKIPVTNTPDVLNDCVADLAMGLLIDASRGIVRGDRHVRAGKWPQGEPPLAARVSGKRLGVVGMGRIGRIIARRASGFDMQIAYHARHRVADVPFTYRAELVDLAKDSDYLVVVVPGGKETRHLVNEAVIRALGPQGILVNVARGTVVDEAALVKCLREGALGGAALDVFDKEPRVPEALWPMDNVVLAPHIGSATRETRAAMCKLTIDNLVAHFSGKPLLTPIG